MGGRAQRSPQCFPRRRNIAFLEQKISGPGRNSILDVAILELVGGKWAEGCAVLRTVFLGAVMLHFYLRKLAVYAGIVF